MSDFIRVTTLNGIQELYIVKPLLQEEGINFYIKNENFVQMDPLYSNATGGLDVMVATADAQRAYDILVEAGYIIEESDVEKLPDTDDVAANITHAATIAERTHCPFCNSDDIRRERSRRFMAILLLIGIPVPATSWIYRCFDCGKLFNKEGGRTQVQLMGTRDSYTIIAAIDKVDYPAIKELLLKHEIDSEIKPAFEEENGEPHGPMVDLYVHYLVASQAIKLLTKYKLLPREGDDWGWFTPLVETKAALFIVYTIITLGLIWAIVWAATQAVHGNFISTP